MTITFGKAQVSIEVDGKRTVIGQYDSIIYDFPNLRERLTSLDACKEAMDWVGDMSYHEAWLKCERGDWMVWYLARTILDHSFVKSLTRYCVEVAIERYPNQNSDFTRNAAKDARYMAEDALRAHQALCTVARLCWDEDAEGHDADDSGGYQARRAALLKEFAHLIRGAVEMWL
jgi:hypothetical protein